jgi:tetraprenyl-beta-curcumene synthase
MSAYAETLSALAALALYRARVLPAARRELGEWDARAARIPAGPLRDAALEALGKKRSNPEATAVFAILAPRATRPAALRAMVALQVAVDYLDSLGERAVAEPLGDGLALHGALIDAVTQEPPRRDWYRLRPKSEDGGYLQGLVTACRQALVILPSRQVVAPELRKAVERCGEGQARTHASAAVAEENEQMREWAEQLPAASGCRWWEVGAGASSSVAAHALIAAAADLETTADQAASIDAAYFPSIGALTVLLDDLLDREADLAGREHNYLTYYEGPEPAAERIGAITANARAAVRKLPRARRHGAILAGVAGFYLSEVDERDAYARVVRERILQELGPGVRPIMTMQRLRGRG